MNSPPVKLTSFNQLEKGQYLRDYLPLSPIRRIIGSYLEDKIEEVFQLVLTIAPVPLKVARFPMLEVKERNAITRGFIKRFNEVIKKTRISNREFDYYKFVDEDPLKSSPRFFELIPQVREQAIIRKKAIRRVSELLKSEDLEVELVSFLISILDEGLLKTREIEEIVTLLKKVSAPHSKILELVEIAIKIHSIRSLRYDLIIPNSLETARELVTKNPKYLRLVFNMLPLDSFNNFLFFFCKELPHAYIISSLIESDIGMSKAERLSILDLNSQSLIQTLIEERDFDIPFSKGEIVVSILVYFENLYPSIKIRLSDLVKSASFGGSSHRLTREQFEEKKKQFLDRFSLRVPFPSKRNSPERLLADYFVEAILQHNHDANLDPPHVMEIISNEIRALFSEGATAENAWNYVVGKYKTFGLIMNKSVQENMSDILIKMGIPIGENALSNLLYYEISKIEFFRPHFERETFSKILGAVLQKKIAALNFTAQLSVSWVCHQLMGIFQLLEGGDIPSQQDISELRKIFNFLNINNELSYFGGRDYPKEAHKELKQDKLIQEFMAKIKALINKPPPIV